MNASEQPHQCLILDDQQIVETVARLQRRIGERFPHSGLFTLCGQLLKVARQASERSRWIARPILAIRLSGFLLVVLLIVLLVQALRIVRFQVDELTITEFVQTFEAGINEVILLGAGIYFLVSVETRIKRRRALAAIHELRSMAHIIDMHQLTKDPERTLKAWKGTTNSPRIQMTPLLLNRYLDYCSEMLALTGKIAALYVQQFDDPVSLAAVSEVEQMTNGLSRKIWQKIMILQQQSQHHSSSGPAGLSGGAATGTAEPPATASAGDA